MYAGITLRNGSGEIIGVHQKVNRSARLHLDKHLPKNIKFPNIKDILYFEGKNGPDAIKRKSPLQDEPFHFINPSRADDRGIFDIISNHMVNLNKALLSGDNVRSSFEAAWLAHAVVDGLTPPHHCPMDDRTVELLETTYGFNKRKIIIEKFKYWGMGGAWYHIKFEGIVAFVIALDKYDLSESIKKDIKLLHKVGFEKIYTDAVKKIYDLRMYDEMYDMGWTKYLVKQTRKVLLPEIVRFVTLAWYQAAILSEGK